MRWPVFSRTSFAMARALRADGVRPATVLDAGANVGQFTVAARNVLHPAQMHAFEPLPAAAASLRRHCARYPEVTVHEVALGDADARATLHVNAHSQSSSLLDLGERHLGAFPRATVVDRVEVEVRRLDAVLDGGQLRPPALLKVDTQGFEPQVLAGAEGLLDRLAWVVVEASFEPLYVGERPFRDLVRILEGYGFAFARPVGALRQPSGEYVQLDGLFTRD